ncbi:MAG: OsmC family protein [Jatrophihabitans sp.]|uniref:OsmC family protein n=1 Tax=Jatrophihabitans sp. TaxID=1932789 RepID=UPI003F8105BE
MDEYTVIVASGALRSRDPEAVQFPHRWKSVGVTVQAPFTGAHLLHLSIAGCVLNDVHREAERLGVEVHGVRVVARGSFDTTTWRSTGVTYVVEVDAPADADVAGLLAVVDEVAEIPQAARLGAPVRRAPA